MGIAVPAIECADHADSFRIGGPYGKSRARCCAIDRNMRPELVVNALVPALAEQMQIEVRKPRVGQIERRLHHRLDGPDAVRIVANAAVTGEVTHVQAVVNRPAAPFVLQYI